MPRVRDAHTAYLSPSRAVADGTLDLDVARPFPDLRADLRAMPGIGDWTAQYISLRALQDPDAFPAGDLGVRKALATDGTLPTERQASRLAEAWRPWRAYAVLHLWFGMAG